MKEMKYQAERKIEVLDTGFCFGLLYYILNLGTHPTAYIKIPEHHKLYGKNESEIHKEVDIDVHFGLTYADDHIYISKNQKLEGWFIGWDYAHYNDYMGYEEKLPIFLRSNGKKWTTEEIFMEVKDTCFQIARKEKQCQNQYKEKDININK